MSNKSNKIAHDSFEKKREEIISGLKEYLAWPSISTDPAYRDQCEQCVSWLRNILEHIGFKTEVVRTKSLPALLANWKPATSGGKKVLYYGHYDVQPVDPVNLWSSPPFKPEIRGERIYARGALDNKGQTWYVIKALEELIQNNQLKHEVTLLIEGEEECGSEGLIGALPNIKESLKADTLLVCDTGTVDQEVGTIVAGMRGLVGCSFEVSAAKKDLHSGIHGGVAPNPLIGISQLIASLYNTDGSVAIDGFYDGVSNPSEIEQRLLSARPFSYEDYIKEIGVEPLGGERKLDPNVRVGFRPTLEINGINGGYGGPGAKTVIPAVASGKLTSRIVSGQNPEKVLESIKSQMRKNLAPGFSISFSEESTTGGSLKASIDNHSVSVARAVLLEMFDVEPVFSWFGASIPVVASLATLSGADPVLVGFGLEGDNMHAPNESFSIEQLRRGYIFVHTFMQQI